jgi:integrase
MTDYVFKSGIGTYIHSFVEQKQACGYPYRSSSQILHRFDLMVTVEFPEAVTLTKEICNKWISIKQNEHPNGLLRRITPVRQLGKYMNGIGVKSYVIPGHIPNKQIKYEAHIFTETELRAFFQSVDKCPISVFSPLRHYVIPVLFRMLYCCGMRSSEARLLKREDVCLDTGKITIRESKGWKSRIVYMSKDLLEVCREYHAIINRCLPECAVFFPNQYGKTYNGSSIDVWFHEFWDHLPEASSQAGNPARVHDFRHSYAVERLNRWVHEKQDINALYPYLSEYMGHSNFADTDYYLSLIESFYPEMEDRLGNLNRDILPEVCNLK